MGQVEFNRYVVQIHRRWQAERQSQLTHPGQSIDLGKDLSARILDTVMSNLPSYIPNELKASLHESHPAPIIAMGAGVDKRMLQEHEAPSSSYTIPENITEGERDAWHNGMVLLTEIATDSLAIEITNNITNVPPAVLDPSRGHATAGGKRRIAERVEGLGAQYEGFRQQLVLAMLTGNKDSVNAELKNMGYDGDINRLAVEIGTRETYHDPGQGIVGSILGTRLFYSYAVHGMISDENPGVVNIPLAANILRALLSTGIAGVALERIIAEPYNLPTKVIFGLIALFGIANTVRTSTAPATTLVHELVHYLGQGMNHSGLYTVERQTPSRRILDLS